MRKRNLLKDVSKCIFPDDLNVQEPMSLATLAKIAGVDRSGITRAVNGGTLYAVKGKINLGDVRNVVWLTKRLTAELLIMSPAQRDAASHLLRKLENLPATTPAPTAEAPAQKAPPAPARKIQKYSPAKLKPGNYYHVGTMTPEGRLLALVGVYLDIEYPEIDIEPLTDGLCLCIDTKGKLESITIDGTIQNLFFM